MPLAHVMMMEQVATDIIQVIALIMKTVVLAMALTMLIVSLYEVVREEIRESRRLDEIAQETPAATIQASQRDAREHDDTAHPG